MCSFATVCLCVCVELLICPRVCVYVNVYSFQWVRVHSCGVVCVYARGVWMHWCLSVYVCIYMYVCTGVCVGQCMCVCANVCKSSWLYVCMLIFAFS